MPISSRGPNTHGSGYLMTRPQLDVGVEGGNAGGDVVKSWEKARGKRTALPGWDDFGVEFGDGKEQLVAQFLESRTRCSRSRKLVWARCEVESGPAHKSARNLAWQKPGLAARLPLPRQLTRSVEGGSRISNDFIIDSKIRLYMG